MGRIGFLFNVDDGNVYEKYVVFLESDKVKRHIVIGDSSFREEDCYFYFLNDCYYLEKFFVFDNSHFKYAKVSVAQRKCVDFEYLTLWFEPFEYKMLRENLFIDSKECLEEELKKRAFRLFKFFEKHF